MRYALFLPFMWAVLLGLVLVRVSNVDLSYIRSMRTMPTILLVGLFIGVVSGQNMFSLPPKVPEPTFISASSATGLLMNTALPDIRCWDAPLPCSSGILYDWPARIDYDPLRGYFLHPP